MQFRITLMNIVEEVLGENTKIIAQTGSEVGEYQDRKTAITAALALVSTAFAFPGTLAESALSSKLLVKSNVGKCFYSVVPEPENLIPKGRPKRNHLRVVK